MTQSVAAKPAPPKASTPVIYIWKRNGWRRYKLRER